VRWASHLQHDRRRSVHTVRAYLATAHRFIQFLGSYRGEAIGPPELLGLSAADLRAFLGRRRGEGLGAASAARELSGVRAFLKYAAEQAGETAQLPRTRAPRRPRTLPRPASPEDARGLAEDVADAASTPWIGARADWSPPRVAALLSQAGSELIAQPLSHAAMTAAPDMAMRLLHYLEVTRCTAALPAVRALVARGTTDIAVRVACLKLIGQFQDPKDLALVRSFISDSDEGVRAQAAAALGTIGMPADEGPLIMLLSDSQWDVRYRAAEALAHLPFMKPERMSIVHAPSRGSVIVAE